MAKAARTKTRTPGVAKVGSRYEWRSRRTNRSGYCDRYDEAVAAKAAADRGAAGAGPRDAFATHAREWIDGYAGRTQRGFSEATRKRYRESLELYAIPYFEQARKRRFAAVTKPDVKAFVTWLANAEKREGRELGAKTINATLAPLKAMYADALDEGSYVGTNPAHGVRANVRDEAIDLDADDNDRRAFTPAELGRVLDDTGVRWGELAELRGRDLKSGPAGPLVAVRRAWDAKSKRVGRPKSGKVREIPISPELARALWRLQRRPDDLLFTSPLGERLNYQNTLRRIMQPVLAAASQGREATDVTWAAFHTFRHTFATLLIVVHGANVKRVSRLLGHHAASYTLDVYTHLFDDDLGPTVSVTASVAEQTAAPDGGPRGARWISQAALNQPKAASPESADLQAEAQ
jgi:integrase